MFITNQSNVTFIFVLPDGSTVPGQAESNIVSTEIISVDFSKLKATPRSFIEEGEMTTQTVTLTNNTLYPITNLFFNDSLGNGATHIPASVVIDNVSYPGYDIVTGFNLSDLPVGGSTTIAYTVIADNPKTQDSVDNFATVNYTIDDPISGPREFTENTNTVTFAVIALSLSVVKSVDKGVANRGEILTYTSLITNTGTQTVTDLVFSDVLQPGITFVPNSVKINDVLQPGLNPITTFALPNLSVGASVKVEFQVVVN